LSFIFAIFESYDLINKFSLHKVKLLNFLLGLRELYCRNENPFHNFTHAVTVLHGCYYLVTNTKIGASLEEKDILLLFISAIGHDVDHPGFNNAHECARKSPIALRYQNDSVLENHHADTTFQLLKRPESSVLDFMSKEEEEEEAHKFMLETILYTDMKRHGIIIDELKKFIAEGKGLQDVLKENKLFIFQTVLHCSDLQNPAKPFAQASKWGGRISQEFYN
jgi:hypothetical protein